MSLFFFFLLLRIDGHLLWYISSDAEAKIPKSIFEASMFSMMELMMSV